MSGAPIHLSTVVLAAAQTDLVSLADIKLELEISDGANDAWLKSVISRQSQAVANFCNRVFQLQTYEDRIWMRPGADPGTYSGEFTPLLLANWPIAPNSNISVVIGSNASLVEDADFTAARDSGQLIRLALDGSVRPWARLPTIVQYQAGFASIPADLQEALIRLVKMRWFARGRDPLIRSESASGIYDAQYFFGTGPGGPADMPTDIAAMLDRNYRVPVIA